MIYTAPSIHGNSDPCCEPPLAAPSLHMYAAPAPLPAIGLKDRPLLYVKLHEWLK